MATIAEQIREAFISGWSERDVANIFNTTRSNVRSKVKDLDKFQKEIHRENNKVRNERLNIASRRYRKEARNNISFAKAKEKFHTQSLNGAKGHYGTIKRYRKPRDTLTKYLEPEYE